MYMYVYKADKVYKDIHIKLLINYKMKLTWYIIATFEILNYYSTYKRTEHQKCIY